MAKRSQYFRSGPILWIVLGLVIGGRNYPSVSAQDNAKSGGNDARNQQVDYSAQIKPLLRERCYACHGALKQQAGLRLDTAESLLRGGDSGPIVVKGNPAASRLVDRISAVDVAERMPPEHEGEPLSPQQVHLLRDWIAAGAPGPPQEQAESDPRDHWAFRPITRPPIPKVSRAEWVVNPIDAFIAQQHERLGLTPQVAASRLTLLRRLSMDITGLPPSAADIASLNDDVDPDWYERIVTQLLDDPRYGERWGRHWMDIWRYSDWWGLGDQLRNSQKHIWHWRDWIIESLNDDLPYDAMVRLMLAADELHPNDLNKLRATGYLARNYFLFNRNQWMDETVEHVSKGFLGLTVNCAKCHDHKYDPITHDDYYRLRAFFEPYHVRMDMLPGQADLGRDGLPRAFDGLLDLPTYRYIRGQESQPDKSKILSPGVPKALELAELKVKPITLPSESFQPERRPWVADAYRVSAQKKLSDAKAKFDVAREKLAAQQAEATTGKAAVSQPEGTGQAANSAAGAAVGAQLDFHVAEAAFELAQCELRSVEQSITAMQATWKRTDNCESPEGPKLVEAEQVAARAAARTQREVAAAEAKLRLAEAELRLHRAAADKREAANKDVTAAREMLDKLLKQIEEPSDQYKKLVGAEWTPTRFFNSGKDDPAVTFPAQSSGRRKALAEWITDSRNPLTARVAVNHIWLRHFGSPLVSTVFDFGRKGTPPTHPELLDWLAAELIDSGWSMKHLHRLMVQSATYRQSSSVIGAEANIAIDPDNSKMWRRTPIRLESQVVRDSVLALAGTLDGALGGPPVPLAKQTESTRRSLYFFHSNNERNLFLTMFDEALVKDCYRREQSIVPQQALALTNSKLVLDSAPRIAESLFQELSSLTPSPATADDPAFVRWAFHRLLGSEPNEKEVAASVQALQSWNQLPEASKADAGGFARSNLIWILLNHNDFVTLN